MSGTAGEEWSRSATVLVRRGVLSVIARVCVFLGKINRRLPFPVSFCLIPLTVHWEATDWRRNIKGISKSVKCALFLALGSLSCSALAAQSADDPPFVNPVLNSEIQPIFRVPWGAKALSPRNLEEHPLPAATPHIQWRTWSPETFAEAARTGRAMFLFVTAPWVHSGRVMERTTLTDSQAINILNDVFIPVHLNRDERPDIDMRLQQAVSTLSGVRGWPLTVFMTAEGRMFHGATSYPREDDLSSGKAGLRSALRRVEEVLREGKETMQKESTEFQQQFQKAFIDQKTTGEIPPDCLDLLARKMQSELDEKSGGPPGVKFPTPRALDACLDHYRRFNDIKSLHVCTSTLTAMLRGGMYDHLAGGFHRCCVDRWWRVPRFEKLLLFNAEMLSLCLHAWQESRAERYKDAVERTVAFWETMSDRETGLFFNAQSADVNGLDDGDYFTWSVGEVEATLPDDTDCRLACAFYGLTEVGNLPTVGTARNMLLESSSVAEIAREFKLDEAAVRQRLENIRVALLEARLRRQAPTIDRALYVDGNALMAAALIECGKALDRQEWLKRGETSLKTLVRGVKANTNHVFAGDSQPALALDEASIMYSCSIAYQATRDELYLKECNASLARWQKNFRDEKNEAYIDRAEGSRPEVESCLNWKVRPYVDTSEPSAAGLAARACARLFSITNKELYKNEANAILKAFGGVIVKSGPYAATLCSAADAVQPKK
jgi:uncharacterized protein YyaL (SSP411 family)